MTFVELVNDVPKISTLNIADGMNVNHKAIMQSVTKYRAEFDDLGTLDGDRLKSKGRPTSFYWMNEEHTIFVCALMKNTTRVIKFKQQLARDFVAMKKTLLEIKTRQQNASWIEDRKKGKISRREETDIIKEFVNYAQSQGSTSAARYYTNITRMENKALFIVEQKFKNLREALDGQQLVVLNTCDQIVAKSLRDGMAEGMHYKEIFKKAKGDVLGLVKLIGATYVPNQKQIKANP